LAQNAAAQKWGLMTAEAFEPLGDAHRCAAQPEVAAGATTACGGAGRGAASTLRRSSSAPRLAGAACSRSGSRPASAASVAGAGSGGAAIAAAEAFRSQAIATQVRLREQLLQAGGTTMCEGEVAQEQLRAYGAAFEAVIACDDYFGPALRIVKDIYDAHAEQYLGNKGFLRHAVPMATSSGASRQTTPTKEAAAVASQLVDLDRENRRLREVAGRLHRDVLRRKAVAGVRPQRGGMHSVEPVGWAPSEWNDVPVELHGAKPDGTWACQMKGALA